MGFERQCRHLGRAEGEELVCLARVRGRVGVG